MSKETAKNKNDNSIWAQTDYQIIGIEPGAGIMAQANKAIEDYQLNDWQLAEGSSAAMAVTMEEQDIKSLNSM